MRISSHFIVITQRLNNGATLQGTKDTKYPVGVHDAIVYPSVHFFSSRGKMLDSCTLILAKSVKSIQTFRNARV